ncbi:MAG: sugar transferase [Spirochaetaceae bacterium]|nr:sugar transferase [Spirochaetaceae bacterium]
MTRFFDILFSGFAIIVLFPFMIPIVIGLKLTGEHDIFYCQERIGKGGEPFKVIKFATMLRNSPNMNGGLITAANDPRILPMGRFLRKTKINELPQLLNIFVGQMSVIGYRPFATKHYQLYSDEVKQQINKIPPGLSGIGSVVFRNEEEILHSIDNAEYFHDEVITPYKGLLECWYVNNRSITNYFKLIVCTVLVVLYPSNNMWTKWFQGLPPVPENLKQHIL